MRTALAEKLLVKIMGWSSEEVSVQRPLLQALASFKYDEYQQFSPGMRFIESLVKWLEQFNTPEEKKIAYNFFISKLIFISNDQIAHLVNITFSEKVNPILIANSATKLNVKPYLVAQITGSKEYSEMLRRSLFIGVSDGSRIDLFRRSKREISNEQVFPSYYIEAGKAADMIKELNEAGHEGKFNSVFLIDDFTASGKSYFRQEYGKYTGKIYKFLTWLFEEKENPYKTLVDTEGDLNIQVIFYIATRNALTTISEAINAFITEKKLAITCEVDAVQIIENEISEDVCNEIDFINLISKPEHFDQTIVDSHYKKGKHDNPYLGFNECALPIILNHNTPNNSLPILWFPEDSKNNCVGLFPRVTRHKDEQ
ncbi:MAG TPA: hypothetical protein PK637_02060 [Flavobacteriales bacterium]|nr:hypothetical protein [Flavobacteriales bacterium]